MYFDWLKRDKEKILNNKKAIPVSVVLVVIKSRLEFVNAFVLPSIEANNPAEIIIIDDEDLSNQEKRNKGARQATQKYLFICDDDVIMPANHLKILYKTLEYNQKYAFAYTDYQAIVMDPETHPIGKNYYHKSKEFSLEELIFKNYIDTCSLVKKEFFPYFDPDIKRFQDWDLWLTIALKGHQGIYVKETGIIKYYLDEGITSKKSSYIISQNIVLKKHNLSNKFYVSAKNKNSIAIQNNLKNKLVFFGVSNLFNNILNEFSRCNVFPNYICDNDINKHGKEVESYIIYNPEILFNKNEEFIVIITSSFIDEIKSQLNKYPNIKAVYSYNEISYKLQTESKFGKIDANI
ncbi:hypothetical protein AN286_03805 [Aliarcobacter cryaerophilus ATCC 43158]|uniref:Glycosyltransferase, family 2 n=1 Tax=Aliarcobacter cryaerophilus ATCC 43158 TaxID=1032070 RepID=A0AAD0X8P5_9BACT|nr:glycosyltransferase [Aliarcobacter cryaerophilus]AYJ79300.1 glycosyltransferase, family 2 [Aliarcobacter cryaerophilus ATCC 43158]PRM97956.1 hypothetical protein CJ667_03895 [Aliarcobacter cryaerophilus]QCZ23565.1 hypothetical protein AN286_03805 [Aliarcobacter cryaerophilus ATCC 43158]